MAKNDDEMTMMLVIGGIALIGGVLIFAPNILGNNASGTDETFIDVDENGDVIVPDVAGDLTTSGACGTSFARFINYYGDRVAEELNKYKRKGVSRDDQLEIKGKVLLSYKNDLRNLFEINSGCIVTLEGEAKAIFVDIVLRVADRMNIRVPSERKAAWRQLIAEELNRARAARIMRSKRVTKISVL